MGRRLARTTALIALLSGGGAALGQETEAPSYEPTNSWYLSSHEGGCSLQRDFAHAGETLTFVMRRALPGERIEFALIGEPVRRDTRVVEAGFVPEVRENDWVAPASIAGTPGIAFAQGVKAPASTDFEVRGASGDPIRLATGDVAKPLEALDECVRSDLERLGVDMAARDTFRSNALPAEVSEWAGRLQNAYPAEALVQMRSGPVTMRLVVDESGRATHCHTLDRLTARALRDTACALVLEYGRFTPAIDAAGEPRTDYTRLQVQYALSRGRRGVDAHGLRLRRD